MHLLMLTMRLPLTATSTKNTWRVKQQVDAAAKALTLSQARYDNGYTSYLEVIIMQTNLFDAQLLESTTLQQKLNSIVSLYKALGGGWK